MSNRPAPISAARQSTAPAIKAHKCPIPGCNLTYARSTIGWAKHVGSVEAHPFYHPEIIDPKARRDAFRAEYPDFFAHTGTRPSTIPPASTRSVLQTERPLTKEDIKALFREVLQETIEKL